MMIITINNNSNMLEETLESAKGCFKETHNLKINYGY